MRYILKTSMSLLFVLCFVVGQAQTDSRMSEYENETVRTFMDAGREKILQNYEQAVILYKQVLKQDRKNPAAAYELSRVYDVLGQDNEALDLISKAVEWDSENVWYQLFLSDMYDKLSRFNDGAATLITLIAAHPNTAFYYKKLAYFYTKSNHPSDAIQSLDQLEKIDGVSEETIRKKHTLYLGMGQTGRAAAELEKLVKFYPSEVSYAHLLASFYAQINELEKSKQVYKNILKKTPDDARAKLELAKIDSGKNLKGAGSMSMLSTLESVFQAPETNIDTKIKAILPLVQQVDTASDPQFLADIIKLAKVLTKVHGDDPKSYALLGDILYNSGDSKAALSNYKKAIELNAKVYPVWSQAMRIAIEIDQKDDLWSISSKALDYFPNKPDVYFMHGIALSQKGDHNAALSVFQQAKLMTRKNDELQAKSLAYISSEYFYLNQKDKGMKLLLDAEKLDGNNPAILEQLGDASILMGKTTKAKEYWNKALINGGNKIRLKNKIEK